MGLWSVRDGETLACMMQSRNPEPGVLSVLKTRGVSIPFQFMERCPPEWSVNTSLEAGRVDQASLAFHGPAVSPREQAA